MQTDFMKKNRVSALMILYLGLFLLFPLCLLADNLLNYPQKIIIDKARNRLLVSNAGDGSLVQIDSLGNQTYVAQYANFVDGMEIVGDTLYGVGNPRALIGYNLTNDSLAFYKPFGGPGSHYLSSVCSDSSGHLFISCPPRNTIYKFRISDQSFWTFAAQDSINRLIKPNGILLERDKNRITIIDDSENTSLIHAISLSDSTVSTLVETDFNIPDGITRDKYGYYYVTGFDLDGMYRFNPDFSGPPVMIHAGASMIYPTYDPESHSIYVTHYMDHNWEQIFLTTSANQDMSFKPQSLQLKNWPNPFNPSTKICFELPVGEEISLEIYNIKGQKVISLYKGFLKKGTHSLAWDGKDQNKQAVCSGIYFIRLSDHQRINTRKILLMK